uniref:AN1-type zinc finger protein 2A-like isoform X2 n=1 Tax=Myxine glutinosa TaxID=7769 RepID=UPI00358E8E5B
MKDFLPMKCDACEKIFCKDHFIYRDHNCPSAYKKDVQVPLCPLCGRPVPVPKGVLPDVGVGQHMDNDCKAGAERRKGLTTRCTMRGCKQRDFVQVICSTCSGGFCIRHRHPPDHACVGHKIAKSPHRPPSIPRSTPPARVVTAQAPVPVVAAVTANLGNLQGDLTEEEALQIALQLSLSDNRERDEPSQSDSIRGNFPRWASNKNGSCCIT